MEDFWLIVVTEGNEDETEINEQERPGGENGSGKAYAVVPGNPVPAAPVGLSPA